MYEQTTEIRTVEDIDKVGRAVGAIFKTNMVVIVGSQSILLGSPRAPVEMRMSPEIDAFFPGRRKWENQPENVGLLASEMIDERFGEDSPFHERHGFFIDGVDERTAVMPSDWAQRAFHKVVVADHAEVTIVAPDPEDVIIAKLMRFDDKDQKWSLNCSRHLRLDIQAMLRRLGTIQPDPEREITREKLDRAALFISKLTSKPILTLPPFEHMPSFPKDTHNAFATMDNTRIIIKKWDDDLGQYNLIDNPLGPAVVSRQVKQHWVNGLKVENSPEPRMSPARQQEMERPRFIPHRPIYKP